MQKSGEASGWRSRDLHVEGVRSRVYEVPHDGSEDEAVVFVHGNPGPSDDWFPLAPTLSRLGRLIAADMPGFGHADHPRAFDFSIEGYARHLGGLLEQLGVRRAHLVLHDFGAAWGARWALDHPGALASVTLINPLPLCAEFRWHWAAKIWQTPVVGEAFQRLVGFRTVVRPLMDRDNPRPLPPDFHATIAKHLDWPQKRAVLRLYRACSDVPATLGRLGRELAGLHPKTCILWGADDPYVPSRYAEPLRTSFHNARLHLLPGLGHWPVVEDPTRVGELVEDFLRGCSEASAHPRPSLR